MVIFLFSIARVYSQAVEPLVENEQTAIEKVKPPAERTLYMPKAAYTLISFDDVQIHNPYAGLMVSRFNALERDKVFTLSLYYSPQIINEIHPDFPGLYHSAAALISQKIKQHSIIAALITSTNKPIYGGLNTFMGFAGYSYQFKKWKHFSMTLGVNLVVMDIGLKLDNGVPWMLWPMPTVNLSWEYQWIHFSFTPTPKLTIAPNSPFCLTAKAKYPEYDVSFWYRFFKNKNPAAELLGMGIGIKNDTTKLAFTDGSSYGINYNALYGTLRLFTLFEASGGWVFNGKEGYEERIYERLISYGGVSVSKYNANRGNGFFISISARMLF